MGGAEVYAKYLAMASKDYTITPFVNKHKSPLDYYSVDGIANWGHKLFHYCKMDVMKKIIGNSQLRFSDIHFLEDTTEFKEEIKVLELTIKNKKSSMNKELYDILMDQNVFNQLNNYFQRYPFRQSINDKEAIDKTKPLCRVYTCSLSMHGDLQYMWDKYASENGVSINIIDLESHIKSNERVKVILGRVLYTEEDKIQCIEALLKDITTLFSQIPDRNCRKDMIQTVLISAMNNLRIFMKRDDFSREDEYRAVLIVPDEIFINDKLPNGYNIDEFERGNKQVPCIDVSINLESIRCFIINSDEDFASLNIELKDWLKKQNLSKIRIYKSNLDKKENKKF